MDELEAIWRVRCGEREPLDWIAENYYDDVYRFCAWMCGSGEEAYDLAQETFLRFLRYVDHYRHRNLKGYLLTIARNVCIDDWRAKGVAAEMIAVPSDGWERAATVASADDTEKDVTAREEQARLRVCLQRLPMPQREAIVLHYLYGRKLREIAAMTGVGTATVKSRIRQGLAKLREWIESEEDDESV